MSNKSERYLYRWHNSHTIIYNILYSQTTQWAKKIDDFGINTNNILLSLILIYNDVQYADVYTYNINRDSPIAT